MASLIDTYGMPPDALLKQHDGACRYISHTTGKTLTRAQVVHIHGLGKIIVPNFEDSATNAKGGAKQGTIDGQFVVAQLRALGAPKGVACYASADYEVHSGQLLTTTIAYFRAYTAELHAAGYLSGAYGDYDLVKALLDAGAVDFAWQCAAWSYGKKDSRIRLYQDVYTQGYDVDEIENTYIGAWTPTGAQTPPEPDLNKDQTTAIAKRIAHDEAVHAVQSALLGGAHGDFEPSKNPAIFKAAGEGLNHQVTALHAANTAQEKTISAQAKTIATLKSDLAALQTQVAQLAAKS